MKRSTIVLPLGTLFVTTANIPLLIAMALHPHPAGRSARVVGLYNNLKNRNASQISPTHDASISNYKYKILKKIFKDLPPLKFPLTEGQWKPYEKAFRVQGTNLRWELIPEYEVPQVAATWKRRAIEAEQADLLKVAVTNGKLKQIHPDTGLPTRKYLEDGRVLVRDLTEYVAQYTVHLHNGDITDETDNQGNYQSDAPSSTPLLPSTGLSLDKILQSRWPLTGKFTDASLKRALSDPNNHKWLLTARTKKSARGTGSALWNPAILADCLLKKEHAKMSSLVKLIRSDFPDWQDEWKAIRSDEL